MRTEEEILKDMTERKNHIKRATEVFEEYDKLWKEIERYRKSGSEVCPHVMGWSAFLNYLDEKINNLRIELSKARGE